MKRVKRVIAIILSIAIFITCNNNVNFFYATVYVEEADNANFNLYTYRADQYLKEESVCYKKIQNMMATVFPSQLIVYNLNEEESFQNKVSAWKGIHYANSPSEISEGGIDEKGYYEAIILSVFVSQATIEHKSFDFGKKITSEINTIFSNMNEWVDESDQLELEKVSKNQIISTLSIEEKERIEKYLKREFKDNHPALDASSNISDALTTCFSAVETVGEAVELMAYYSNICDVSFEAKVVLMDMYEKCPNNNLTLKTALYEVALSMDNYNLGVGVALLNAAEKVVIDGIGVVTDCLMEEGWNYVFNTNPYVKAFSFGSEIGIAMGDAICNNLFSTDKIIEQYQKMKCLCEFTELVKLVVNDMENEYVKNPIEQNAKNYFSALDALFSAAALSCDYASNYGDIIYSDSLVGQVQCLFSKKARENYKTYISSIDSIKKIYEQEQQSLINNYLSNLEYEYPMIYAALTGKEEISYINVSGIEFIDDELIIGLEDDYIYNVGTPKVYPENATDRTVQFFSSDETVVSVDKNGGWLMPKQVGTAIVSAVSIDGNFSSTIQITIVDGKSEKGETLETASFISGDGSEESPYLIYSEKGLAAVRNDLSGNYELVADIYMDNTDNWERIGTKDEHFSGVLNGNGHSIYNFNIINCNLSESFDYNGLFAYLEDAVVKNINFVNANLLIYGEYIGVIAGQADNSLIVDCNVNGNVYGPGDYGNYVGGVVGVNKGGMMQGISFSGCVDGNKTVGGITAKNSGIVSGCVCLFDSNMENSYVAGCIGSGPGGIVGLNTGTVEYCYNTNYIWGNTWSGNVGAGGIVGQNKGNIKYCYNLGNVRYACQYWHRGYVGGICGRNEAEILDCYNLGQISSDRSHVCGIASDGNVNSSKIKNCYNIGKLEGGNENEDIKGYNYGISDGNNVESSYYLDNALIEGSGDKCTIEELSSSSTYIGFDFEDVWFFSPEFSYPQLNMALNNNVIPVIKVSNESGNIPIDEITNLIANYDVEQLIFGENESFASVKKISFDVNSYINGNKGVLLQSLYSDRKLELADAALIMDRTIVFEVERASDSVIIYGYNGDINADTNIDIKDIMKIMHHISGRTSLNEIENAFADVDMNDKINLQDLMRELHYISGRLSEIYEMD